MPKTMLIFLVLICLLLNVNACYTLPKTDPNAKDSPVPALAPVQAQQHASPQSNNVELISPETKPGKAYSWYYIPNAEHLPPRIPAEAAQRIADNSAIFTIPNSDHRIYLTFDEGYELGYSGQILDILLANNVKAAFFVSGHYIKTQPQLVQRMKSEGHLVCNHTQDHKDLALLPKPDIVKEINSLEQNALEKAGVALDKFLRPPMGNYSDLSLAVTREAGYTTVFWSMALKDWDPNQQPGAENVYKFVIKNIHPGAVILLHAVSKSDTEALDEIIKELNRQGYSFATFPQDKSDRPLKS